MFHTVIISTKFESDIKIHIPLPSYSILAAGTLCNRVTLTFGHVLNPSTEFQDLRPN